MKTHKEKIICPICKTKQWAIVEHTLPWYWNYTHKCKNCDYVIMESEWEQVDDVQDAKKEAGFLVIILAIFIVLIILLSFINN